MRGEETIVNDFGSKGIRLDIYISGSTQVFNLEMQSTDTNELPERARYYQGAIDVDCLKSGQKYKELKDSYVIFICIPDVFEKGLPCYTFENLCLEDTSIHLNDRAYKYFFIADNCDKILDEKQKAFLGLVVGKKASDKFSKKIEQLTEEAKHNTEWKRQYMEWERQRTYDFENGKEFGEKQKAIKDALLLIQKYNISPEDAAKDMNAPLDKVLEMLSKSDNTTPSA